MSLLFAPLVYDLEKIIINGLLVYFVQYLMSHARIELICHVLISCVLRSLDSLHECFLTDHAWVFLSGNEMYLHVRISHDISGKRIGPFKEIEQPEISVYSKHESVKRIVDIFLHDFLIV